MIASLHPFVEIILVLISSHSEIWKDRQDWCVDGVPSLHLIRRKLILIWLFLYISFSFSSNKIIKDLRQKEYLYIQLHLYVFTFHSVGFFLCWFILVVFQFGIFGLTIQSTFIISIAFTHPLRSKFLEQVLKYWQQVVEMEQSDYGLI